MKTLRYIFLIFTFALNILFPRINYSQTSKTKDININIGGTLNIDANADNIPYYSGYIAPALRLDRHEFSIGCLINERTEGIKFKPSLGAIIGYKYYVDKNAGPIQFYLNYSFIYQRYYYPPYYWYTNDIITSKERLYNNSFGYGLNFYLTKKRNIYFYQTTGYTISCDTYKTYVNNKYDSRERYFFWTQIMFTAGLTYKLTSFK